MQYLKALVISTTILLGFDFSASCKEPPLAGIMMLGGVTEEGLPCYDATVTLFMENNIQQIVQTNEDGSFQVALTPGKIYTVEVSRAGLITKRISIDTHMERTRGNNVTVFDCYVNMVPEEQLEGVDTSDLDFPIALLSYDKKLKTFVHDPEYTSMMQATYSELKKAAQELEE
jgi:hypothetical protein